MATKLKWFGVKTVYRTSIRGKATQGHAGWDGDGTLVEERIVLVRARDHDQAIRRAETEAREYTSETFTNRFGQVVSLRRLRVIESFELFDDPAHLVEVWSTTMIVPKSVSDNQLIDRLFGSKKTKNDRQRRLKYLNAELLPN